MKDHMLINENKNESTLDERINTATLESYIDIIDDLVQLDDEVKKEAYANKLAIRLKVKPAIIVKAIDKISKQTEASISASFPGLVDLVEDDKGNVSYLVKKDNSLSVCDKWVSETNETFIPPQKKMLPFELGKASNVIEAYASEDISLYDDLIKFFKRFSYLPDEVWPLVVFSVFLSYLQDHKDVRYIPTIYFYAVAERGKSRTAKSILSVAYRGVHLVDLRSANIVRYSQDMKATLFFDCTDLWGTAAKMDCTDILLGRFEKGAMVSRVKHPDRGAFLDMVRYDVFGSTVVATNEPANTIFESRCLTIMMPNKPGEYENMTPDMGIELKERLIAWRAKMMDKPLPELKQLMGISGRLWDISKPLFQLCEVIKPEVKGTMRAVLLDMVEQKSEDKKESMEGQIIAAIDDIVREQVGVTEWRIAVEKIRGRINIGKADRFQTSPQKLGKRLKSLSLNTKLINGYSYLYLNKRELDLLKEQYGLVAPEKFEEPAEGNKESLPEATTEKASEKRFLTREECERVRVVESEESAQSVQAEKRPVVRWRDPVVKKETVQPEPHIAKKPVVRWRNNHAGTA